MARTVGNGQKDPTKTVHCKGGKEVISALSWPRPNPRDIAFLRTIAASQPYVPAKIDAELRHAIWEIETWNYPPLIYRPKPEEMGA
jgi:hypothetical protein